MKRTFLACTVVAMTVGETYACSRPAPLPFSQAAQVVQVKLTPTRIVTSKNGQYLFKMVPARAERKASATAYKVLENGDLKAIWSITKMPSLEKWDMTLPQYILANDGHTLIIWDSNWEAKNTKKTALRVFNRGKLSRSYSTDYFINDGFMKTLRRGPCGENPSWLSYEATDFPPPGVTMDNIIAGGLISLRTADKKVWQFEPYNKPLTF